MAQPGDREPGSELKAGEAAPKFASYSPGAAAAPFAEVSWRAGLMLGAGGARGAGGWGPAAYGTGRSPSPDSALCAAGGWASGGPGPGPCARLPAPLQGERPGAAAGVAGTPSWAARCGARAATGGPGGARPAAPPAPPSRARLPASAHTHTPSGSFHVFLGEVRS